MHSNQYAGQRSFAYLPVFLGQLSIPTKKVHIRMCAHDVTINLLHHLCILATAGVEYGEYGEYEYVECAECIKKGPAAICFVLTLK